MKLTKNIRQYIKIALSAGLLAFPSCSYLDVIPQLEGTEYGQVITAEINAAHREGITQFQRFETKEIAVTHPIRTRLDITRDVSI